MVVKGGRLTQGVCFVFEPMIQELVIMVILELYKIRGLCFFDSDIDICI